MKLKKYVLLFPLFFVFGFLLQNGDIYYRISKSIEIFGEVYKQATLNYVDEIKEHTYPEE